MSRRVTTQIGVTDKTFAIQALKISKSDYQDRGESLFITSGPFKNTTINLKTGEISGDSDYAHTQEALGKFRQAYGEAKYLAEIQKQGGVVESRSMEGENVVLMYAMG